MAEAKILKPSVSAFAEDIDSFSVRWTLPVSSLFEGAPAASCSFHNGPMTKVVNPTDSAIIDQVAFAQRTMFEPPAIKTVSINDGNNTLNFTGYDAGPAYTIAFGNVSNTRTLVHPCARLMFINTAIYKTEEKSYAEAAKNLQNVDNAADAIFEVTATMLEHFGRLIDSGQIDVAEESKEILRRIHLTNVQIMADVWFPILMHPDSKKAGIKNFGKLMKNASAANGVMTAIKRVYESNNSDFSSVISQLETLFQIRFVPSLDGSTPGKFISFSDAVTADVISKTLDIRSISINAGLKRFLPVTGVAIKGLPGEVIYAQAKEQEGKNVACWPDPLPAQGQILVSQAPSWIPTELAPPAVASSGTNLSIEQNQAMTDAASAEVKATSDDIRDAAKEIAKQLYNTLTLGDSSATVITVLEVDWEIGKRYQVIPPASDVTTGPPAPLFTGFLRAVEHRLNSNPSSLEASTHLTFSHIEVNGFTLPNKQ